MIADVKLHKDEIKDDINNMDTYYSRIVNQTRNKK